MNNLLCVYYKGLASDVTGQFVLSRCWGPKPLDTVHPPDHSLTINHLYHQNLNLNIAFCTPSFCLPSLSSPSLLAKTCQGPNHRISMPFILTTPRGKTTPEWDLGLPYPWTGIAQINYRFFISHPVQKTVDPSPLVPPTCWFGMGIVCTPIVPKSFAPPIWSASTSLNYVITIPQYREQPYTLEYCTHHTPKTAHQLCFWGYWICMHVDHFQYVCLYVLSVNYWSAQV